MSSTNAWLRRINRLVDVIMEPSLAFLSGSPLRFKDPRLAELLDLPTNIPLQKWRPTYSVFHDNNGYLNFKTADSSFTPLTHSRPIMTALSELCVRTKTYDAEVRLQDIDSILASRSNTPDNRHRWTDMEAFGRWAFYEYLPSTIGGTSDPVEGRRQLISVLDRTVKTGGGEFGSIRNQLWCNRVASRNTGISRRLAALVYLAKKNDEVISTPFLARTCDEQIDYSRLNAIAKLSETYVLIGAGETHAELKRRLNRIVVPVACFGLKDIDPDGPQPHLYCLVRANSDSPDLGRSSLDHNRALHRQQRRLYSLLEAYVEQGVVSSLENYVHHVCRCLSGSTHPSNNH
ncbi:MAG: hypothetical protein K0U93_23130 [Gammaproteobacteria bacterium]|nr:hypothetical protein [Gammaproteobacteria bacterium]